MRSVDSRAFHRSNLYGIAIQLSGGLTVGGGESIHGRELAAVGGMAHRLRDALEASAEALLVGKSLPESACQQVATAILPPGLYRLMGGWGWRVRNLSHGFPLRDLRARPFDAMEDAE